MWWYNELTEQFLKRGYLAENETIEDKFNLIHSTICKYKGRDWADKILKHIRDGNMSLSTPILNNYGKKTGLPISCFNTYIGDSIESILKATSEVGMMCKQGVGTSGVFTDIRSRGSKISAGGAAHGPVSFLPVFKATKNVISQGTSRRGEFAPYLSAGHPDIMEWLTIRNETSELQDLPYGIVLPEDWYDTIENDEHRQEVMAKIIECRFNTGFPYIVDLKNCNGDNLPNWYKGKRKVHSSNMCVSGDTEILTKNGYVEIQKVINKELEIWNGFEWSTVTPKITGNNQHMLKITLSDGRELVCTDYHKWYLAEGYTGRAIEKRTIDLKIGDKLIKHNFPILKEGISVEAKRAYTQGFISAEGMDDYNYFWLYETKNMCLDRLDVKSIGNVFLNANNIGRRQIRYNGQYELKSFVPFDWDLESRLQWLSGLFDGDGTELKEGGFQLVSTDFNFLKNVQKLISMLGINSKIVDASKEGYRIMPDGKGGSKEYYCAKGYRILINSRQMQELKQLGLVCNRMSFNNISQRDCTNFVKISKIEDMDYHEDVYCFNEPLRHYGVFNGILTGQCSEVMPLSTEEESYTCCLASANAYRFNEWKNTDLIECITVFLDSVYDDFLEKAVHIPFMDRAYRYAKNHRPIGIGLFGWHSYLQKNMIPFESMEAKNINVQISKLMKERSYNASKEQALIYGEPEFLKGSGMRNGYTLAIAPTKSTAFIFGQMSEMTEPRHSNIEVKDLAKSLVTLKNKELENLLKSKGFNTNEIWNSIKLKGGSVQHLDCLNEHEKNVFKTFMEISPKEIIIQASQRQKYIDQSQSLNLMIHPDTTAKDYYDLLKFGHDMGIKTFYYHFNR